MSETTPILELRDIRAGYGPIEVVHGINLAIGEGSVTALLGPNGGGKTTLLNVCAGIIVPSGGEVHYDGRDVTHLSADGRARRGICTVPEGRGIFPNLSVRENLLMATQVGVPMDHIEEVAFAQFPQLGARRKQLAGTLSGGEQQMLALARAFATDPKLLLLDEPASGQTEQETEAFGRLLRRLVDEQGLGICLVEHDVGLVMGTCETIHVLDYGEIIACGSPEQVKSDPVVVNAYLGAP